MEFSRNSGPQKQIQIWHDPDIETPKEGAFNYWKPAYGILTKGYQPLYQEF